MGISHWYTNHCCSITNGCPVKCWMNWPVWGGYLCLLRNRGPMKGNAGLWMQKRDSPEQNMLRNCPQFTRSFSTSECVSFIQLCFLQGFDLVKENSYHIGHPAFVIVISHLWPLKSVSQCQVLFVTLTFIKDLSASFKLLVSLPCTAFGLYTLEVFMMLELAKCSWTVLL